MVAHKDSRPRKVNNPLIAGIEKFILEQSGWSLDTDSESYESGRTCSHGQDGSRSVSKTLHSTDLPKRYTLYEPMLLLGPTFQTHTPTWQDFYLTLTSTQLNDLFQSIAQFFCKSGHHVTHIAANAPIQATLETQDSKRQENMMRSPVNLQPLFGDFGPASYNSDKRLTSAEMNTALWVETSQVGGIKQVWAPRWTMFSRGNIREKSRVLGQQGIFPGLSSAELSQPLSTVDVVDFYVGIGYFAFSYLKRGVRTVFGWDLNLWSIEGLRRGCEKNGWQCLVVMVEDDPDRRLFTAQQIAQRLLTLSPPRCVAFCGDNVYAVELISYISAALKDTDRCPNIRHANLGLLPTSQGAWEASVRILNEETGGWLHIHENVEIALVSSKEQDVINGLEDALPFEKKGWTASCENVEMVKTYAPGVGHYVFDVRLSPAP